MKILLVNKFYYRRAGAEAYLLDLESLLTNAGHEVAIFATKHPETLPTPWARYFFDYLPFGTSTGPGEDVQKVGRAIWSRGAARCFTKLLTDFEPDIVHLHNIYHHLSPSLLSVCGRMGVPVVQTLHDYKWICPNYTLWTHDGRCERCHVYRYWNAVLHRCVKGSLLQSAAAAVEMSVHRLLGVYEREVSRFITPSAFLRDVLIRWGKDGNRIVHIPNAMDLSALGSPAVDAGASALFVGRFEEWKGVRMVLDAAAGAPDIPFRLVGSGPLASPLAARASALALTNVTFLGFLPRGNVANEIRESRVVLVPSEGYDPFPTVALEAGALGRPVVGSAIGGIPEIVRDGETGLLVPPGNAARLLEAIRRIFDSPSLAVRLGVLARTRVRALVDPATHGARLTALYAEVIAEQRAKKSSASVRL